MSDRRFPKRPIVAVGAVIVDGDRVLLVKRSRPPLEGAWSLPGGVVEVGESLEQALLREVREETGLGVDIRGLVEVLDRVQRADTGRVEYHYVIIDYLCAPTSGTLTAGSDAADARWVSPDELEGFRLTAKALAVVRKALSSALTTRNSEA